MRNPSLRTEEEQLGYIDRRLDELFRERNVLLKQRRKLREPSETKPYDALIRALMVAEALASVAVDDPDMQNDGITMSFLTEEELAPYRTSLYARMV